MCTSPQQTLSLIKHYYITSSKHRHYELKFPTKLLCLQPSYVSACDQNDFRGVSCRGGLLRSARNAEYMNSDTNSYSPKIGLLVLLYILLCNQIYQHAKIERTAGRRTWLLFAHSTAIFITTSIDVGYNLKFFEMLFVTCWEDPMKISMANEICLLLAVCLQDSLLVSGLTHEDIANILLSDL